jgi:hypothetical protein
MKLVPHTKAEDVKRQQHLSPTSLSFLPILLTIPTLCLSKELKPWDYKFGRKHFLVSSRAACLVANSSLSRNQKIDGVW